MILFFLYHHFLKKSSMYWPRLSPLLNAAHIVFVLNVDFITANQIIWKYDVPFFFRCSFELSIANNTLSLKERTFYLVNPFYFPIYLLRIKTCKKFLTATTIYVAIIEGSTTHWHPLSQACPADVGALFSFSWLLYHYPHLFFLTIGGLHMFRFKVLRSCLAAHPSSGVSRESAVKWYADVNSMKEARRIFSQLLRRARKGHLQINPTLQTNLTPINFSRDRCFCRPGLQLCSRKWGLVRTAG